MGEEAFGVTLPQVKIANNRYCCSSMGTNGSLIAQQRASQFVYRLVFLVFAYVFYTKLTTPQLLVHTLNPLMFFYRIA